MSTHDVIANGVRVRVEAGTNRGGRLRWHVLVNNEPLKTKSGALRTWERSTDALKAGMAVAWERTTQRPSFLDGMLALAQTEAELAAKRNKRGKR